MKKAKDKIGWVAEEVVLASMVSLLCILASMIAIVTGAIVAVIPIALIGIVVCAIAIKDILSVIKDK